ncbi:MAG: 8-amino-7-oxononanoate synthase [Candidatus Melainabacteria bacterium]|nr:8-amino-7-oxononanoate synthase [Candidatus Melainabacteria bacterium]
MFNEFFSEELNKAREKNLYRQAQVYDSNLISFSSNDYLGLARRDLSLTASRRGASASRITSGTFNEHIELENFIAQWKGAEAALIFNCGYMANLGTLSVILNSRDIVFADEYVHACILDGIRLSGAKKYFYKHNNTKHLAELIQEHRSKGKKSLIVTESVFSMDGDKAKLPEINEIAQANNASIYIDEAHGTGVLGSHGAGLVEELVEAGKITKDNIVVQMGTLSKAGGLEGGYIAGSKELIEFLKNKSRTFIYSTANPPLQAQIALKHLQEISAGKELRDQLQKNIELFETSLRGERSSTWQSNALINYSNEGTPIFAIHMPSTEAAQAKAKELEEAGYLVVAIRPPTVPNPRLRICINSIHEAGDIERVAGLLRK